MATSLAWLKRRIMRWFIQVVVAMCQADGKHPFNFFRLPSNVKRKSFEQPARVVKNSANTYCLTFELLTLILRFNEFNTFFPTTYRFNFYASNP